jgi:hypothetical protein
MRKILIPDDILALPAGERLKAIRERINEHLHRRSICPIGQYFCGIRTQVVGIVKVGRRYFYIEPNFDSEYDLEAIVAAAFNG